MATKATKVEGLTHREAKLILKVMDLDKKESEMKEDELAAVGHYMQCHDCNLLGIGVIRNETLSCREAILVWAKKAGALHLRLDIQSLRELLAAEHVWGSLFRDSFGCQQNSCLALKIYWRSIPMSSHSDGPEGVIYLFPRLFEIFVKENWPLKDLLEIQQERIADLLDNLRTGKITVSPGHYHNKEELVSEICTHVSCLQHLVPKN